MHGADGGGKGNPPGLPAPGGMGAAGRGLQPDRTAADGAFLRGSGADRRLPQGGGYPRADSQRDL